MSMAALSPGCIIPGLNYQEVPPPPPPPLTPLTPLPPATPENTPKSSSKNNPKIGYTIVCT